MAVPNESRPFSNLEDDEFDDLLDSEVEDSETLLKLLLEAAKRGYEGDGVESVLDRFLERGIDDLYRKYQEAFDLFFDGVAIDCFVDDATQYLAALVNENDDEEPESDEQDQEAEAPVTRSSDMPRTLFPVAEYYADHVLDGVTLSRKGGWWSALLLIRDPKTHEPFLNLYRWEQVDGTWKNRKSFVIRDQKAVDTIISALNQFRGRLPAN
jgi:hypothetical protein